MRWFWIDRFVAFECGRHATSIKCVSLAEDHISEHFPGAPIMPNSLIIEGMALTGGLLMMERSGWRDRVVLAKISKAIFHEAALAGDQLTYHAVLEDYSDVGGMASITSRSGDTLQAELELFYASVDESFAGKSLFRPGQLYDMLRSWRLFEVGRNADGTPLVPNDVLLHDGT